MNAQFASYKKMFAYLISMIYAIFKFSAISAIAVSILYLWITVRRLTETIESLKASVSSVRNYTSQIIMDQKEEKDKVRDVNMQDQIILSLSTKFQIIEKMNSNMRDELANHKESQREKNSKVNQRLQLLQYDCAHMRDLNKQLDCKVDENYALVLRFMQENVDRLTETCNVMRMRIEELENSLNNSVISQMQMCEELRELKENMSKPTSVLTPTVLTSETAFSQVLTPLPTEEIISAQPMSELNMVNNSMPAFPVFPTFTLPPITTTEIPKEIQKIP